MSDLLQAFSKAFNNARTRAYPLAAVPQEEASGVRVTDVNSAASLGIKLGATFRATDKVLRFTVPQLRALAPFSTGLVLDNVGEVIGWPFQGDGRQDVDGAIYVMARRTVGDHSTLRAVWLWRPRCGGISWRLQVVFTDPIARAVFRGEEPTS